MRFVISNSKDHMSIDISIRTAETLRYATAGDWVLDEEGGIALVIKTQPDPRYEILIAVHELIEAVLCEHRGITTKMVDDFDMSNPTFDEPGEHPDCPYRKEHKTAEIIERILAQALDVDFNDYIEAIQ